MQAEAKLVTTVCPGAFILIHSGTGRLERVLGVLIAERYGSLVVGLGGGLGFCGPPAALGAIRLLRSTAPVWILRGASLLEPAARPSISSCGSADAIANMCRS